MTRPLWLGLAMAAIGLWASAGGAKADSTLWYNGDFDGNDALRNQQISSSSFSYVYDDFIVPGGQTWTLNSVFSNNLIDTTGVTSAYWEIRSGVMSGDGGNLLYSGTDSATQAPTGGSGFGLTEYTITADVSGASPPVILTAGTYWLAVAPILSDGFFSYASTTSGANAIGMPPGNDGNSFVNSTFFGTPYEPASDFVPNPNTGLADFSMGVTGIAISSVPEPSTLVLGLLGTLTVFGAARLRLRRRVG
jgi:hypothetical protein